MFEGGLLQEWLVATVGGDRLVADLTAQTSAGPRTPGQWRPDTQRRLAGLLKGGAPAALHNLLSEASPEYRLEVAALLWLSGSSKRMLAIYGQVDASLPSNPTISAYLKQQEQAVQDRLRATADLISEIFLGAVSLRTFWVPANLASVLT